MNYGQILWPRVISSVLWTTILHAFPLGLYIAVMNVDILHPMIWLHCIFSNVFNIGNWLYLLPVYLVMFALGVIFKQEYTETSRLCASRFHQATRILSRNMLAKGLLYILLGAFMPYLYLRLNENNLTTTCKLNINNVCLDEKNIFILCSGVWTGLYFFVSEVYRNKYEQFPPVQQLKFLQVRQQISQMLKDSASTAIYPVFYFVPFYFLYGSVINEVFESVLTAKFENVIIGISGIFNIPLFVHAWLMATSYNLTIRTLKLLFHIHMTEHHSFSLILTDPPESLLFNALSQNQASIIKKLAFYDLYVISCSKKTQRSYIFMLSQPGGHAYVWNAIIHECFKQIRDFIAEVENINKLPEPKKDTAPLPKHTHPHHFEMTVREQEMLRGPVPLSPVCKLRKLVGSSYNAHHVTAPPTKSTLDSITDRVTTLFPHLYLQSGMGYFFGSLSDAKVKHMLSNCECVIWAVLSMSELSASALVEDQFGIVLHHLPDIINLLLDLRRSLEKISKLHNVQKKFQKKEDHVSMRDALKSAVRRGLYRIAISYEHHLQDLPLSPQTVNTMNSFVLFKEC